MTDTQSKNEPAAQSLPAAQNLSDTTSLFSKTRHEVMMEAKKKSINIICPNLSSDNTTGDPPRDPDFQVGDVLCFSRMEKSDSTGLGLKEGIKHYGVVLGSAGNGMIALANWMKA